MVVLIADDEPKIRKGLAAHLKLLKGSGITKIDIASNGIETMDKIKEIHPDIILLDICMPQMTGIQLIEALALEEESPCIIVISGYDDFSYAKTALRYGVYDYLVKPLDLKELDTVLLKAIHDIKEKQNKRERDQALQKRYAASQDYLLDSLFRKIIRGLVGRQEIAKRMRTMLIPFHSPMNLIAVRIQFSSMSDLSEDMDADLYDYALHNILKETCSGLHNCSCFVNWDQNCAILYEQGREDPETFISVLQKNIDFVFHCDVNCEISQIDSPQDLRSVYTRLIKSITSDEFSPAVAAAVEYIKKNYSNFDLSLQEVADTVGFSPTYLSKSMRLELNASFSQYLTNYRMHKAAEYLQDKHHSQKLYEIAMQCGFSSQHYFSRAFRKFYGLTPSQYREAELPEDCKYEK